MRSMPASLMNPRVSCRSLPPDSSSYSHTGPRGTLSDAATACTGPGARMRILARGADPHRLPVDSEPRELPAGLATAASPREMRVPKAHVHSALLFESWPSVHIYLRAGGGTKTANCALASTALHRSHARPASTAATALLSTKLSLHRGVGVPGRCRPRGEFRPRSNLNCLGRRGRQYVARRMVLGVSTS